MNSYKQYKVSVLLTANITNLINKQMKTTIKKGLIVLALCGAGYFGYTASQTNVVNNLALQNIEALANNEGNQPTENYQCYGWGEVDCYGYKVEVKYSGFSLD